MRADAVDTTDKFSGGGGGSDRVEGRARGQVTSIEGPVI
jgi:hypothetical protein